MTERANCDLPRGRPNFNSLATYFQKPYESFKPLSLLYGNVWSVVEAANSRMSESGKFRVVRLK